MGNADETMARADVVIGDNTTDGIARVFTPTCYGQALIETLFTCA